MDYRPNTDEQIQTYQAIELTDWTFVTRLWNIPHFDATLTTGVHIFGGIGNGDGAHNFTVR